MELTPDSLDSTRVVVTLRSRDNWTISAHAALHGADRKTIEALMQAATTDACLDLLESCGLRQKVVETLADKAQWHVSRRVGGAYQAGLVFYSQQQGALFITEQARQIIEHFS